MDDFLWVIIIHIWSRTTPEIRIYCFDSRSIDRRLHPSLWTGDLPLPFPPYTPFSLTRRSIDSFTFVATNIFIVQGLQYLILHFDFPWTTYTALWVSWSYSYCTVAYLRVFIYCISRKCIMVYILLSNNIVTRYNVTYNLISEPHGSCSGLPTHTCTCS